MRSPFEARCYLLGARRHRLKLRPENFSLMTTSPKWYSSVTRYQWLVLTVASLGWVFDAFEGQIYNLTRADMLPGLLDVKADDPLVKVWGERFLGIFLLGGTFGGLLFSSLADKWGRNPVMTLTILFYSIFSGITAFAVTPVPLVHSRYQAFVQVALNAGADGPLTAVLEPRVAGQPLARRELTLTPGATEGLTLEIEAEIPDGVYEAEGYIDGDGVVDEPVRVHVRVEIIGDEIARTVAWQGGADVSRLAGRPVRLRFVMKDADLFSMRFLNGDLR